MSSVDYQEARSGRHILSITNQDGFYKLTHKVVGSNLRSHFHFDSESKAMDYAQEFVFGVSHE